MHRPVILFLLPSVFLLVFFSLIPPLVKTLPFSFLSLFHASSCHNLHFSLLFLFSYISGVSPAYGAVQRDQKFLIIWGLEGQREKGEG